MRKGLLVGVFLAVLGVRAFASDAWLTSYDDAMKLSKKSGKPVMAYFTGSDWCIWCHRLDDEVLDTPTFQKWATDHVVLLKLDFPQQTPQSSELKAQNSALQAKFSVIGFPTVHVLDYHGDDMANQGYEPGGPDKWISHLGSQIGGFMDQHPSIKSEYERAAAESGHNGVPLVQKPLHAKTDLRGKSTFSIVVDKWLTVSKPDFGTKVVVLELFSTSSDVNAKVVPTLSNWSKEFSDDVDVIAVSNDSPGSVLKLMHSADMPYFVGIDSDGVMAKRVGIGQDPYILVLTPDGIVRWQGDPSEAKDALTTEKLRSIVADMKAAR
jgi:thiol-disulfide isomerase/thioredoxin